MCWRIAKAVQAVLAHGLLFSFTILLVLKLDHSVHYSWWITFAPLWLFHLVVVRGRFSIPAPSTLNDRHWAPFHAVTAMPLFVAFELLLCVHLESNYDVNLKVVFFPLLAFQIAVLVDNVIMCRALMPGDEESMSDEAIWETLPHFWVAISMVFFIAATTFTVLKLCGDVAALGWWDLFINYGVAECFSFLNCTRWYNPAIHRHSRIGVISSSSANVGHFNGHPGAAVNSGEDDDQSRICSLQDVGGHIMKIPIVGFQILLFMRLEGTPSSAHNIPIPVLFAPLILMQGTVLFFSIFRLVEKCILLFNSGALGGRYLRLSSQIRDCFEFMNHGSRLLGWWSIDEVSHEEHARLYYASSSGYNTFSPEIVKKMPKADLVKEISRLQAALSEQAEVTKCSQEEYERLQNEKILCRICFENHISIVLLPCRHHALCSSCCDKCKRCPICRVYIDDRLPVYDV